MFLQYFLSRRRMNDVEVKEERIERVKYKLVE